MCINMNTSVLLIQLYQEFVATYKHWFDFLLPRSTQKLVTGQHASNRSFKIIAECPVIGAAAYMLVSEAINFDASQPCRRPLPPAYVRDF